MRLARVCVFAVLTLSLQRCSCDVEPGGGGGNDTGTTNPNDDGGTTNPNDDGGTTNPNDDGGTITVPCIADLRSLAISPATSTITLDGAMTPTPITFTAQGTFADGHSAAIDPDDLAWFASRTDQTPPGAISAGVFTPNAGAGGLVTITATDGCISGDATVTFFLDLQIGAPTDPAPWQQTPVTNGGVPTIVYPSDETRFPRNIYRTLFQWRAGNTTEFRLTFEGRFARVVIFTDGAHTLCTDAMPRAGCWEAGESEWNAIASSNAGSTVTWTVDGLDPGGNGTIRRGAPITIGFSRQDVAGAIFYWSTTSKGIRRANIRASDPEDYVTGDPRTTYPPDTEVQCVACHVVSRSGRYLAAPTQATTGKGLWISEVSLVAPPPPLVTDIEDTDGHGFATISPDDAQLVAAWKGKMWMLDRATGARGADLPLGMMKGTHPDWSPLNDQLVFATGEGDAPGRAGIALMSYDSAMNVFRAPEVIVPAMGDRTNLFPMFSPDGAWIAFSRGKGGHGDREAQLFITGGRAGGPAPVELVRANRVVSNAMGDGQHQNSQPTWAPPGDLAWIAFNTKREYGVVLAEGTQQIWVAAIDTAEAAQGRDPSYPAFRIPFQGLDENNHRAFWALDVRDPPDAGPVDGGDAGTSDAGLDLDGATRDAADPDPPGGADGGAACLQEDDPCDPVTDTCCGGAVCDTKDDGVTYTCVLSV